MVDRRRGGSVVVVVVGCSGWCGCPPTPTPIPPTGVVVFSVAHEAGGEDGGRRGGEGMLHRGSSALRLRLRLPSVSDPSASSGGWESSERTLVVSLLTCALLVWWAAWTSSGRKACAAEEGRGTPTNAEDGADDADDRDKSLERHEEGEEGRVAYNAIARKAERMDTD